MPAHLHLRRSGRGAAGSANGNEARAGEPAVVIALKQRHRPATAAPVKSEVVTPPMAGGLEFLLVRLVDLLQTWMWRSQQRRQLGSLSDSMLKDIGVSRADVDYETSRRFWRD